MIFIGATSLLVSVPLLIFLGSPVLWMLLIFVTTTLAAMYWALNRSYADGRILEELTVSTSRITLTRHGPGRKRQDWEANPYWIRIVRHDRNGPVPYYLTLHGGPRDVEIGAFLSEEERRNLVPELETALARARRGYSG